MPKFFIERPIFAIVIALLIMLAGGLSIMGLPVEQVPPVAPPTVQITTTYPGASAQTVENTVVQVIEQQMSGIDNHAHLRAGDEPRHRAGAGAEQAAARRAALAGAGHAVGNPRHQVDELVPDGD